MKETKEIISHLKDKGFVFSGSSIYGGLANSWDYGPLGTMLKNNIKDEWKKFFIDQTDNVYHLDSGILLNPKVWEASGHVGKFNDPMIDCKDCKERFRSDHLIEKYNSDIKNPESLSFDKQTEIIQGKINCPKCNKNNWTDVRAFELMFKVPSSKTGLDDLTLYLRPETAQGIFINFKNVVNTLNAKIPFGIGQIGKAFRNEVTPGNFIFRTKEFEQMEMQFFTAEEDAKKWFEFYIKKIDLFLFDNIGLKEKKIRKHEVEKESLAHYAKRAIDFEYDFSFGWGEIIGLHNRGDYDLSRHSEFSNESLEYHDQINNKKFMPHVVEISFGVDRLLFAIASEHLITEMNNDIEREVFKLPYNLCPYKISVMPLTNKIEDNAKELFNSLLTENLGPINFSKGGSIGKRYRKQDSIGTMFSITYDFDSIEDKKITIRNRDTMKQERILISEIKSYVEKYAR